MLQIRHATTADLEAVQGLFREYQSLEEVDLCFQGFDAEVRGLPGHYAPPKGRLIVAVSDQVPVGCVALRAVDDSRCEMKRLFVRPIARGKGVGKSLLSFILDEARVIGYSEMVLDTLPTMIDAQRMYEESGFSDIPAYCVNPIPGTRYLGKSLSGA